MSADRPDVICPATVFRVYAWLAIGLGLAFYAYGDLLVLKPYDLPPVPWGRASMGRIGASIAVSLGICALACRPRPQDTNGSAALVRFALAHLAFGVLFYVQWTAIWDRVLPSALAWTPLATGLVLLVLAGESERGRRGWSIRMFGAKGPPADTVVFRDRPPMQLRTQYEEQIRQTARQEERARLARELHDAVKQQLFAIQTAAATVETRFDADATGAKVALSQVRASAREALIEMEVMLDQLQAAPLSVAGLVESLKRACDALAFRIDAEVTFKAGDLPSDLALRPGAHQALLRFAQEALANVARHARAAHVRVRFGLDQTWTPPGSDRRRFLLSISDDGHGFEVQDALPRGMGLRSMAARAAEAGGTFEVTSQPAKGTTVALLIENDVPSRRQYLIYAGASLAVIPVVIALLIGRPAHPLTPDAWLSVVVLVVAAINSIRYIIAAYRVRTWQ
jgi:signal transduction histidine kinase